MMVVMNDGPPPGGRINRGTQRKLYGTQVQAVQRFSDIMKRKSSMQLMEDYTLGTESNNNGIASMDIKNMQFNL